MNDFLPLVSICVQTYNQVNYIEQCLGGILMQQTKFSFEIILGEDESDDGTREICIKYARKFPNKIKLFLRSRKDVIYINGNPSGRSNFIENLKACTGKYIALCEGDDYWTDPLKLQKQVDFMEANPEYSICFHAVSIFNEANGVFIIDDITKEVKETTNIKDLAKRNYIHTPSVVLRNDFALPNWFKDVAIGDWSLYMHQCGNRKIKKLEDIMAVYRISSTNLWSSKPEVYRINSTLETVKIVLKNADLPSSVKKILKGRVTTKKQKKSLRKRIWRKLTK